MKSHEIVNASPVNPSSSKNIRFIDSLRGLSALWVVLGHARAELEGIGRYDANSWLSFLKYIREEHAVPIFIILSGFLLAYPYMNWDWSKWKGSFQFMKKRMLRIYPAYIATILILYVCARFVPALGAQATPRWAFAVPIEGKAVLLHLLMIHNYFSVYTLKIDPPMWSLAVEWQIYLCFAFITVPLGVRFGPRGFVAGMGAIVIIMSALARHVDHLALAFCLGIGVAWFVFNRRVKLDVKSMIMILLTAIFISVMCGYGHIKPSLHSVIYEIAFCLVLIILLQFKDREYFNLPLFLKIVDSKVLRLTGWFSYSLYLVHFPILSVFGYLCVKNNLGSMQSGILLSTGILLSMLFSFVYSVVFEHRKLPANI